MGFFSHGFYVISAPILKGIMFIVSSLKVTYVFNNSFFLNILYFETMFAIHVPTISFYLLSLIKNVNM